MRFIYLVCIIFMLSLNLRPAITSVGPLLDIIQADLGMSGLEASLITSLPVFCMGLFALFSIHLSNRFGLEGALMIAMILIFSATLYRGFITDGWSLIMTALLSGIGIGIAGPLIAGFIKKYFPEKLSVMSIYSVSMVIGASLSTSLSLPLFNYFNASWQISLSFWSLLAFLAALLLLPLLISNQKTHIRKKAPSIRVKNKRVYLFILFFACMAAVFYALIAWLAPFIQSTGLSQADSAMILTLFTLIQIPVSFFVPYIVTQTGKRKLWLLICSFSELIGLVLLLSHASPWLATLFLAFGAGALFPLALTIPIVEADSSEEATTLSAQMQFGGFMLGATGPLLFGLALDLFNSYAYALSAIGILIILMILIIFTMERKEKVVY